MRCRKPQWLTAVFNTVSGKSDGCLSCSGDVCRMQAAPCANQEGAGKCHVAFASDAMPVMLRQTAGTAGVH